MKELLQTFGYTLAIGMVVFFAVMIISKSGVGLAEKWKGNDDRIRKMEKEAKEAVDGMADRVEKGIDGTKEILQDVREIGLDRNERIKTKPAKEESGEFYQNVNDDNSAPNFNDKPIEEKPEEPVIAERPSEFINTSPPSNNNQETDSVVKDDNKTYQIQLGVISKKNTNLSNFKIVNGLGDIYEETIDRTKSRILLGDFEGRKEATFALAEVKQRGLKDAFLVEKKIEVVPVPAKETLTKPILVADVREKGNYIIRLGVFSEPPTEKLTRLSEIGKIYLQAHPTNPNLNTVSLGVFASKSQAEAALTAAKQQSFKDAFITSANNQLIDANSGKGLYYLPDEVEKIPAGSVCVEEYVIQLSAAQRPNVGNFKTLLNMGNLFTEYDPKRDVSKVFVGPFEDKATASQALQEVKAKGFNQAFVVDRTRY
ncbi:MAG: SPOR domain-containing protein [Chitinophagales bacterium]